jgi:uncharacterized protein (TIGR02452 family)
MLNDSFSPVEWLHQYRSAATNRASIRKLRTVVYHQTVEVVRQGEYVCDGEIIKLETASATKETVFFKEKQSLSEPSVFIDAKFAVIEADCVEIAQLLQNTGYNVCMLNMANRQTPGGGVLSGAGAQEENIFRRSNLFQSLYQFVDVAHLFGVERNREYSYPLDRTFGGIYSKKVTFFRGSENNGYCFLNKPFELSVVSVPAINHPPLVHIDDTYFIAEELIEPSKEKIRTILRICGTYGHDALVLSAFGCGAFRNPPNHMAELFKEVFGEPEFKGRFRMIVFAIIDDHNTWQTHNPVGNVLPFFDVFNGHCE